MNWHEFVSQLLLALGACVLAVGIVLTSAWPIYAQEADPYNCTDGAGGATTCQSATNPFAVCGEDGAGTTGANCDAGHAECVCRTRTRGCRCFHD